MGQRQQERVMSTEGKVKKSARAKNEFEDFGPDSYSGLGSGAGSDFSLMAIMVALILFSVASWIGFGQLTKVLEKKSVTPSLPHSPILRQETAIPHPATVPEAEYQQIK